MANMRKWEYEILVKRGVGLPLLPTHHISPSPSQPLAH